jgi:hypothetical protein
VKRVAPATRRPINCNRPTRQNKGLAAVAAKQKNIWEPLKEVFIVLSTVTNFSKGHQIK